MKKKFGMLNAHFGIIGIVGATTSLYLQTNFKSTANEFSS
jgi:hypothetical protein